MKKVLHASDLFKDKKEEKALKPIEFTYFLHPAQGYVDTQKIPSAAQKIVYLGKCTHDRDMFAAYYKDGGIDIFQGHLNDGIIE